MSTHRDSGLPLPVASWGSWSELRTGLWGIQNWGDSLAQLYAPNSLWRQSCLELRFQSVEGESETRVCGWKQGQISSWCELAARRHQLSRWPRPAPVLWLWLGLKWDQDEADAILLSAKLERESEGRPGSAYEWGM